MNLGEAKTQWAALLALGEGQLALERARDLTQLAGYGAQAAASIDILAQAASALVREMGQQLSALRDSPDAAVRSYVALLLDRLAWPRLARCRGTRRGARGKGDVSLGKVEYDTKSYPAGGADTRPPEGATMNEEERDALKSIVVEVVKPIVKRITEIEDLSKGGPGSSAGRGSRWAIPEVSARSVRAPEARPGSSTPGASPATASTRCSSR